LQEQGSRNILRGEHCRVLICFALLQFEEYMGIDH